MNLSDAIGLEIERREKDADDFLPICVPENAAEIRRIYKEQRELVAAQQARIEALEAAARVIVNENTHKQFSHDCGYKTVFANYDRVRDAIDALAALLDSEPSAHTCNASCQRPACVQRRRVEVLEGRLKAYELHYGVMSGAAIQHILNSGHGNNLTEKEWIEAKSEQEGE